KAELPPDLRTTPAASFSRMPPSRPGASPRSRAPACGPHDNRTAATNRHTVGQHVRSLTRRSEVRFGRQTKKHLLVLSFTGFDPNLPPHALAMFGCCDAASDGNSRNCVLRTTTSPAANFRLRYRNGPVPPFWPMTTTVSEHLLEAMGLQPLSSGHRLTAVFHSLHVYEIRGFT